MGYCSNHICSHGILTCRDNADFCSFSLSNSSPSLLVSSLKCWHSKDYFQRLVEDRQRLQMLFQPKDSEHKEDNIGEDEILTHLTLHDDEEESPLFADFSQAIKDKLERLRHSFSFFQSPYFNSLFQRRRWSSWAQSTFNSYIRPSTSSRHLNFSKTIQDRSYGLSAAFTLLLIAFSNNNSWTFEDEVRSSFWYLFSIGSSKPKQMPAIPLLPALLCIAVPTSDDLEVSLTTATTFEVRISFGIGVRKLSWSVHRRFIDFIKLHALLSVRQIQGRLGLLPPFPFHVAYSLGNDRVPWPPLIQNQRNSIAAKRRVALQSYLQALVKALHMHGGATVELAEFLEISSFTLSNIRMLTSGGEKEKEGYLRVLTDTYPRKETFFSKIAAWKLLGGDRRWVILKVRERAIVILDHIASTLPLQVIIIDDPAALNFERVNIGMFSAASTSTASMVSLTVWEQQLRFSSIVAGAPFFHWIPSFSNLSSPKPVSFKGQSIKWFIDAAAYFSSLADILESAKDQVLIIGWWISPELFLRRPAEQYPESRLDRVLKRIADSGVNVYILIFKEWSPALYLNSRHTKETLEALSPRIVVQRHPDHLPPSYWAHHEKLVVVDGKVAFLGGLDLAFGRYDDQRHLLSEYFPRTYTSSSSNINDEKNLSSDISCVAFSSLPTLDIAVPLASKNSLDPLSSISKEYPTIPQEHFSTTQKSSPIPGDNTDLQFSQENPDLEIPETASFHWIGQDYYNPRFCDFRNVQEYMSTLVDRSSIPRMPWHDVQLRLEGSSVSIALHRFFCERWNFVKRIKSMHRSDTIPWLLPIYPQDTNDLVRNASISLLHSRGTWSSGIIVTDTSIYDGYLDLIDRSQRFIYIENQFFISNPFDDYSSPLLPVNRIAAAIVRRVERASADGDNNFRVIIIIPLLPAFEFDLYMNSAACFRIVLDAQLKSLRGLKNRLVSAGIDVSRYLSIFAIRTSGSIGNVKVSEQIYVHSKVLIVDDFRAIVGSPNINDRSMMGNRDSEIALLIEGADCVGSLRHDLLKEHLGMDLASFDPNDDYFYFEILRKTALYNTLFYRKFFASLPDDSVTNWSEYRDFIEKQQLLKKANDHEEAAQGNIVFYPMDFLSSEDLSAISWRAPEYLLPYEVFF